MIIFGGFLSVYTLPTNIYFIGGISGWFFSVIFFRGGRKLFDLDSGQISKLVSYFIGILTLMGVMIILAYYPIKDDMLQVAQYDINYSKESHGLNNNPILGIFSGLMWRTIQLFLNGHLIWFFPFFLLGIVLPGIGNRMYQLIPIWLFAIPVLVALLTGVYGYPRNLLFCFPIFIIFLTAGITFSIKKAFEGWSLLRWNSIAIGASILCYTSLSFNILAYHYYPSFMDNDLKELRKELQKSSQPNDFISISDPNYYLYTQKTSQKHLKNIMKSNYLDRFRMIFRSDKELNEFKIPHLNGVFFFQKWTNQWPIKTMPGNLKMVTLGEKPAQSILKKDIETRHFWKIVKGEGLVLENKKLVLEGKSSIYLKNSSQDIMIVSSIETNRVEIKQPTLVILIRGDLPLNQKGPFPKIMDNLLINNIDQKSRFLSLPMKLMNEGMRFDFEKKTNLFKRIPWITREFIGYLQPGNYTFKIQLSSFPNRPIIYDGIKLFLLEL